MFIDEEVHQQKFYALANPPNLTNEKLECFKCKREVITCQYAYHLAECMGNEMDRVSRFSLSASSCNKDDKRQNLSRQNFDRPFTEIISSELNAACAKIRSFPENTTHISGILSKALFGSCFQ
ncbi:unnamed protein product [Dracunculus medinensis]|uniref:SAGA-associated factor 11 n=1 Tax=Dracunculus medinensis TaxID=318479 RepID=A0A0N4U122_DRAME|nr:unnamed protein product [Dracunculus medinensis]